MASANRHYTVQEILEYFDDGFNIPDEGLDSDLEGYEGRRGKAMIFILNRTLLTMMKTKNLIFERLTSLKIQKILPKQAGIEEDLEM